MDEFNFERWYSEQHRPLVASLLVIARGDIVMATDAADEAFARAYANWRRVGRMESPGGWTYRTAANVLRRRYRRRRLEAAILRRARSDDRSLSASTTDWSVEVWDALRELPYRERTAVALRYVAGFTYEEIAETMGVAPGTVASTLSSARTRLAHALGDDRIPSESVRAKQKRERTSAK